LIKQNLSVWISTGRIPINNLGETLRSFQVTPSFSPAPHTKQVEVSRICQRFDQAKHNHIRYVPPTR
jgi:hypothetical protein